MRIDEVVDRYLNEAEEYLNFTSAEIIVAKTMARNRDYQFELDTLKSITFSSRDVYFNLTKNPYRREPEKIVYTISKITMDYEGKEYYGKTSYSQPFYGPGHPMLLKIFLNKFLPD